MFNLYDQLGCLTTGTKQQCIAVLISYIYSDEAREFFSWKDRARGIAAAQSGDVSVLGFWFEGGK